MAKRFSIESVFKAVDKVSRPVTRMQNRVNKMTRSMSRGFKNLDRTVDKFKGGLKRAVAGATIAVSLLGVAFADTAVTGANFEQAIVNVGAVSMQTRAQIEPLEKLALQLGATTKFTATEAAGAMEILARSGFNAQQILKATPAVLSAAAASGLEIAEVADHVSNVLKGMGLEVSRAAEVADVLALASSKTNSTIGTLGESMRNVAATARQLKIPLTDTVAAVALLQDVGLDASVAGSAMNTMLTKMAAPTKGITKQMKKFGVSFKDAKGDMLPFAKVIEQLNIASKKAGGSFDKVAFLAELVGLRGQKAAANLADLFEKGKLQELSGLLEKAQGSAKKMSDIRMDTTMGSFLLLRSAIDAVKVSIFNMNSGPLKDLIDNTTKWISANERLITIKVTNYIEKIVDNFKDIVKWMKRIGVGLIVFTTLSIALKSFIAIMTAVNLVMAANPVALITIAILSLVAALISAVTWWANLEEAAKTDIFDKMADKLSKDTAPVRRFFDKVSNFFGGEKEAIFGAEDSEPQSQRIITPQERIARTFEENKTTSEVTIKDETGRAEVTGGKLGRGLTLQPTGAF